MKYHVEQQEDDAENHWQDQLQPLLRAQLKFVFAGPFVSVAGWQREFLTEQIVRAGDKASIVFRIQIDVHLTSDRSILVTDHGGPSRKRNLRHFADGNLRASWGSDQDSSKFFDV